jgi:predicted nucleic-acid-binding protein
MIAFDTNLLVRFIVDDDRQQADIAESLIRTNTVFLSRTVLLETEWVLRSRYRIQRRPLAGFFQQLIDMENVELEDGPLVAKAVEWYRLGADFADALHLGAAGTALMHTFDHGFCKAARDTGVAPPVRILDSP